METCSGIFLCKICMVKGSALIPSLFWSQHRTGPSAWYSPERRTERAGAIREGFLEEGVGFRRAEGRAEPWQIQGLGNPYSRPAPALSGEGPRCVLPMWRGSSQPAPLPPGPVLSEGGSGRVQSPCSC